MDFFLILCLIFVGLNLNRLRGFAIHLDARLAETDPQGDLLAEEDVRVVGLLEEGLQLLELLGRKGGTVPALPPPAEHVLREQIAGQWRYEWPSHCV